MTGLLSPSNGSIYINGKKLEENLGSWLKIIGYVPQEIFILDDTLEKNITFGAENKKRSVTNTRNFKSSRVRWTS